VSSLPTHIPITFGKSIALVLGAFNFKTELTYLVVDLQAEVFRKAVIVYIVLSKRREPKRQ
jgi:hypothetical protein